MPPVSELEAVCAALTAALAGVPTFGHELDARARRLRLLASEVDRAARAAQRPEQAKRVVALLGAAADELQATSRELDEATSIGSRWVTATVRPGSGHRPPAARGSDPAPDHEQLDLRAVASAVAAGLRSEEVQESVVLPLAAEAIDQLAEQLLGVGGASEAIENLLSYVAAWIRADGPRVLEARCAQLIDRVAHHRGDRHGR